MREYEKKKPEMRSSQGLLREGQAVKSRDGQDHLTGYRPGEQEGDHRPREAGRLENSFGDISVGTNRKKELTLVTSRRRNQEGPAVREEEKSFKAESAQFIEVNRGTIMTNSFSETESAVAYRQSSDKTPQFMLDQFREMMQKRDQKTAKKQAGFLDRTPETEALKLLRRQEVELHARGGAEAQVQLREIGQRRQELQQTLAEKESHERRLRLVLQKAQEEARGRTEDGWERPFSVETVLDALEDSNGGEEKPSEEENEQMPEEDETSSPN